VPELNPYIFRAYDVRGKVGGDITPPVFEQVGRAYGTLVKRRGGRTVALGMDNRVSSTALKAALSAADETRLSMPRATVRPPRRFTRVP